jgi:uncharacterized YkwD family protein
MKNSIKFIAVLCILVVMSVPIMAFGAEDPGPIYSSRCKITQNINVFEIFKLSFEKPAKLNYRYAPAVPNRQAAPDVSNVPAAPKAPKLPVAPGVPKLPVAPEAPKVPASQETIEKIDTAAPQGNYESQVIDLVNKERSAQGLAPLKYNSQLAKVAAAKASDMRDNNYFSHTSPTYGSPFDMMKSFGIKYNAAGENIAKGYRTPKAVMDGWMNSPGHKANILNGNFTEIGVGYVTDSSGSGYWVQMFIRP